MNFLVCKVDKSNVLLIVNGNPVKVDRDHPNADKLIEAAKDYNSTKDQEVRDQILESIEELVDAKDYSKEISEDFEVNAAGQVFLTGTSEPLPYFLANKIKEFIDSGIDFSGVVKFWKHLLLNPDSHVRSQLFEFLEHNGHPITSEGYFLAYKAVGVKRKYCTETGEEIIKVEYDSETGEPIEEKYSQAMTFKPFHSGNYGMSINIGQAVQMPREECDNDPERTCSAGLHVGSMEYVGSFGMGDRVVLEVLVNPRNVVSVPVDYNATKMRCCEYFPIAISNGENEEIYLESDYTAFDRAAMEKEMASLTVEKGNAIAKLEQELAEKLAVANSIYL